MFTGLRVYKHETRGKLKYIHILTVSPGSSSAALLLQQGSRGMLL